MKRRALVPWVCVVCLAGMASLASAQSGGGLPAGIKGATEIDPYDSQIRSYVNEQAKRLADMSKPQGQADARDALAGEVSGKIAGGNNLSRPFLEKYSDAVSAALTPLASAKEPRVRLLTAVVIARVAEGTNSTQLKDVTIKLLQDPSDAVALWAMKASRGILGEVLAIPAMAAKGDLLRQIVASAKAHPSPYIVQEAYETLSIGMFPMTARAGRNILPGSIQLVIPRMQELMEYRVKMHVASAVEEPMSENKAVQFLGDGDVWKLESPDQQAQAVQAMSDLLSLAAQRLAAMQRPDASGGPRDKDQLAGTVAFAAKSLYVVGDASNLPGLKAAVDLARKVTPTMSAADVERVTKDVFPKIQAIPQFAKLKAPPAAVIESGGAAQ